MPKMRVPNSAEKWTSGRGRRTNTDRARRDPSLKSKKESGAERGAGELCRRKGGGSRVDSSKEGGSPCYIG